MLFGLARALEKCPDLADAARQDQVFHEWGSDPDFRRLVRLAQPGHRPPSPPGDDEFLSDGENFGSD
jgi:hypothetical protein